MKTIVIFCSSINADEHPFGDPYYWNGYQDVLLFAKAHGAQAYFATGLSTYLGGGVFSVAYTVDHKVPVAEFTRVENIKADVVFEKGAKNGKGGFAATDVLVLNAPEVQRIASSKIETYHLLGKYQPKTIICQSAGEVEQAFQDIPGDMIVVKEPTGNGGKYVQIGPKSEILPEVPSKYPLIVQEFLDMSAGVEGHVQGPHDLRIKIAGGNILGGKFRIPAEGSLHANVSRGASERFLSAEEIPAEAKALAMEIDEHFKAYPRYYAADFALSSRGWKLVELNAQPGLEPADLDARSRNTAEGLAKYLVELAGRA